MINSITKKGVVFVSNPKDYTLNESSYMQVRVKEGRILTDDDVANLPSTAINSQHHKEWKLRSKSYKRLLNIIQKENPVNLLDVGCGNGWLIGNLSTELPFCKFSGIDLNEKELIQASRLFGKPTTCFYYLDLLKRPFFEKERFNIIIFNASIQYFNNLPAIINKAKLLLKPKGIIIINDSPFYKNKIEAAEAAKRSKAYYKTLGATKIAHNYFHHIKPQLAALGFNTYKNWATMISSYPFSLFIYNKA